MSWGTQISAIGMAVLAAICGASQALAEAPAPVAEQDVIRMFIQRERDRTEEQWLRSDALPPVPAPYDLRSLQRQLWYSQWWLRQQEGPLPAAEGPYCQPPYFIPRPPFRHCRNLLLH